MYTFESLANVQSTLEVLISDQTRQSLVKLLPRQPGQKEARYIHLLSGEPILNVQHGASPADAARSDHTGEGERILKLEEDVKSLRLEVEKLRRQLTEFKKQFE